MIVLVNFKDRHTNRLFTKGEEYPPYGLKVPQSWIDYLVSYKDAKGEPMPIIGETVREEKKAPAPPKTPDINPYAPPVIDVPIPKEGSASAITNRGFYAALDILSQMAGYRIPDTREEVLGLLEGTKWRKYDLEQRKKLLELLGTDPAGMDSRAVNTNIKKVMLEAVRGV